MNTNTNTLETTKENINKVRSRYNLFAYTLYHNSIVDGRQELSLVEGELHAELTMDPEVLHYYVVIVGGRVIPAPWLLDRGYRLGRYGAQEGLGTLHLYNPAHREATLAAME
jgi:hypothetical protein